MIAGGAAGDPETDGRRSNSTLTSGPAAMLHRRAPGAVEDRRKQRRPAAKGQCDWRRRRPTGRPGRGRTRAAAPCRTARGTRRRTRVATDNARIRKSRLSRWTASTRGRRETRTNAGSRRCRPRGTAGSNPLWTARQITGRIGHGNVPSADTAIWPRPTIPNPIASAAGLGRAVGQEAERMASSSARASTVWPASNASQPRSVSRSACRSAGSAIASVAASNIEWASSSDRTGACTSPSQSPKAPLVRPCRRPAKRSGPTVPGRRRRPRGPSKPNC